MHVASIGGHAEAVRALVVVGADPAIQNVRGVEPVEGRLEAPGRGAGLAAAGRGRGGGVCRAQEALRITVCQCGKGPGLLCGAGACGSLRQI
jgi:hypothetical protein